MARVARERRVRMMVFMLGAEREVDEMVWWDGVVVRKGMRMWDL